jgi:hypothetical protein
VRVESVGVRGEQLHHVLVVGAVAHVGLEVEVGVPGAEGGEQAAGVAAVGLDEVAVEVEVAGIGAEAVLRRAGLVGTRSAGALQGPADVVHGHDADGGVGEQSHVLVAIEQGLCEQQAGIYAIGFAGVDPVGDPEDGLAGGAKAVGMREGAVGEDEEVDGQAVIVSADGTEVSTGARVGEALESGDRLFPRGGGIAGEVPLGLRGAGGEQEQR